MPSGIDGLVVHECRRRSHSFGPGGLRRDQLVPFDHEGSRIRVVRRADPFEDAVDAGIELAGQVRRVLDLPGHSTSAPALRPTRCRPPRSAASPRRHRARSHRRSPALLPARARCPTHSGSTRSMPLRAPARRACGPGQPARHPTTTSGRDGFVRVRSPCGRLRPARESVGPHHPRHGGRELLALGFVVVVWMRRVGRHAGMVTEVGVVDRVRDAPGMRTPIVRGSDSWL